MLREQYFTGGAEAFDNLRKNYTPRLEYMAQ
jgi:hypothetical protein